MLLSLLLGLCGEVAARPVFGPALAVLGGVWGRLGSASNVAERIVNSERVRGAVPSVTEVSALSGTIGASLSTLASSASSSLGISRMVLGVEGARETPSVSALAPSDSGSTLTCMTIVALYELAVLCISLTCVQSNSYMRGI